MPASEPRPDETLRVAIVANTARCDMDRVRALVARERGSAAAGRHGGRLRIDWFPTSADRPGEAARLAVEDGAALVVAVGGDGIAHDVAGAIAARAGQTPVVPGDGGGAGAQERGRQTEAALRLRAGLPRDETAARPGETGGGGSRADRDAPVAEPMLAIVPVGTGNFLARGAGVRVPLRRSSRRIARDVARLLEGAEALEAAAGAGAPAAGPLPREARLDVGEIDALRPDGSRETAWFSVQAGFGWDAEALRRSPAALKRELRWGAYVVGLVRATLAARTLDRGGSIGGRRHDAVGVVASVGGALPLGVRVVPGSRTGDGLLGIALVQPRRALDWFGVVARTLLSSWMPARAPEPGGAHPASPDAAPAIAPADGAPAADARGPGALGGAARAGGPARPRHPSRSPIAYASRREVDLRFDAPTACELDGEPFGEVVAARLRILPAPTRVLLP